MTYMVNKKAEMLCEFLETDFAQSGRDVRIEAIRVELEAVYMAGIKQGTEGFKTGLEKLIKKRKGTIDKMANREIKKSLSNDA